MKFEETEMYKLNLTIEEYYDEIVKIYDIISKKEFAISLGNSNYSKTVEALDDIDRSYYTAIRMLTDDKVKYYAYTEVFFILKNSLGTMRKRIKELGL